jgi:Flp pilus assembly protein TadG
MSNYRAWGGYQRTLRRLLAERSGNIAMSFAVVSVPLVITMGSAIDYMRALDLHREMQGALDAALVAAVADIDANDEATLKQELANWVAASGQANGAYQLDADSVSINTTDDTITATVTANVDTTFLRIIGKNSLPISAQASVVGGQTTMTKSAFSMYFVLDRSGSMGEYTDTTYTSTCYSRSRGSYPCTKRYTKMESLKLASQDLLGQFTIADPESNYVRTGAVSYDTWMDTPTPLAWGTTAALSYIDALTPRYTTNSGEAFQQAYDSLMVTGSSSEEAIHKAKNGIDTPSKYIVFMTDGANNVNGADAKTKQYCDMARTAGIKVYTIAFMAPTQGQRLLSYCATTSADYFSADNTADLVSAFQLIGQSAAKTLVRLTN